MMLCYFKFFGIVCFGGKRCQFPPQQSRNCLSVMSELVQACGDHFALSQARGLHRLSPISFYRIKSSKVARRAWTATYTLNMMHN
ncbi:hypothetical protein Plhal304r1_c022g0078281 [Plasmopara halstedii]